MNDLDLNYLKYFYFVVTCNGFTRAAEKLHVQQPVISRAVKLLEGQLGVKLLERQKKQVLLTVTGREVFGYAEEIFSTAEKLSRFSKESRVAGPQNLSFATSDSLSSEVMGPIFKKFIAVHPGVRPIHHSGPAAFILDKIQAGTIEFGVFFNVPDLPVNLEKTKIGDVSFRFVVAGDSSKDQEVLKSFIASKEQDDDDESSRLPLFKKYKTLHKDVSIVGVSSSSVARKALALAGVGVTILPDFLVRDELKSGDLKSVSQGSYSLPLFLIERKSSYRSRVKNALIDLIQAKITD